MVGEVLRSGASPITSKTAENYVMGIHKVDNPRL